MISVDVATRDSAFFRTSGIVLALGGRRGSDLNSESLRDWTGEVLYREPLTHAAENIGDKPLHMILVELKGVPGAGVSPHP